METRQPIAAGSLGCCQKCFSKAAVCFRRDFWLAVAPVAFNYKLAFENQTSKFPASKEVAGLSTTTWCNDPSKKFRIGSIDNERDKSR